jgi:hypothetical protein
MLRLKQRRPIPGDISTDWCLAKSRLGPVTEDQQLLRAISCRHVCMCFSVLYVERRGQETARGCSGDWWGSVPVQKRTICWVPRGASPHLSTAIKAPKTTTRYIKRNIRQRSISRFCPQSRPFCSPRQSAMQKLPPLPQCNRLKHNGTIYRGGRIPVILYLYSEVPGLQSRQQHRVS